MKFIFSKYQGAGNDFVVIDARCGLKMELTQSVICKLCDRHYGIGSDGFMILENDPNGNDFYMRYFNCDGLESTMCGNGGRAITRFADDLGIGGKTKTFNAIDGLHTATINPDSTITLGMVDVDKFEHVGEDFIINTGSPHYITFNKKYDINLARELRFEHNCNVNFAEVVDNNRLKIRTFERGVEDETWACGTGSTAVALAAHYMGIITKTRCKIQAIGGQLVVQFTPSKNNKYTNISLTGPALYVFSGEMDI